MNLNTHVRQLADRSCRSKFGLCARFAAHFSVHQLMGHNQRSFQRPMSRSDGCCSDYCKPFAVGCSWLSFAVVVAAAVNAQHKLLCHYMHFGSCHLADGFRCHLRHFRHFRCHLHGSSHTDHSISAAAAVALQTMLRLRPRESKRSSRHCCAPIVVVRFHCRSCECCCRCCYKLAAVDISDCC